MDTYIVVCYCDDVVMETYHFVCSNEEIARNLADEKYSQEFSMDADFFHVIKAESIRSLCGKLKRF